jgi:hypothetical protein
MFLSFVKHAGPLLASALLLCPAMADAARVRFTVQPVSGSARIISQMNFRLCRVRNFDPWSPERCVGWRPIANGQTIELVGRYCVFGAWDHDRTHRGALAIVPGSPPVRYLVGPRPAARGGDCG